MRPMRLMGPMGLIGLMGLMGLMGCYGKGTPEEMASFWSENYYNGLRKGDYDYFLSGKAGADSLPDDYREQLLTGYKQFMAKQQRDHQGIREVRVSNARTDSLAGYINVFLLLCFGDSTQEEIVVPMVEHDGRWQMK